MHQMSRPERRRLERQMRKRLKRAFSKASKSAFPTPPVYENAVRTKDAAVYLGVTSQRVSQLVKEKVLLRLAYGLICGESLIDYRKKYGGRRRRLSPRWQ